MKALGRAIEQHLGDKTKSLLKHNEQTEYQDKNSFADLIAVKLDQMATLLDLEPIYSQKSSKVQQKLVPVSPRKLQQYISSAQFQWSVGIQNVNLGPYGRILL